MNWFRNCLGNLIVTTIKFQSLEHSLTLTITIETAFRIAVYSTLVFHRHWLYLCNQIIIIIIIIVTIIIDDNNNNDSNVLDLRLGAAKYK